MGRRRDRPARRRSASSASIRETFLWFVGFAVVAVLTAAALDAARQGSRTGLVVAAVLVVALVGSALYGLLGAWRRRRR